MAGALFNIQNRWAFPIGQDPMNYPLVTVNNAAIATRIVGAAATALTTGFIPNSGGGVSVRGNKRERQPGETRSGKRYRPETSTALATIAPQHRRIEPIKEEPDESPDDEEPENIISQSTNNMAHSHGAEVPVIPHGRVSKIQPDYFTIELPYYVDFGWPLSHTTGTGNTNYYAIRLNSIYDPLVGSISNTQPQGRDNWAANFDFYRVLQTNVKIIFINQDYQSQADVTSGANPLGAYYAVGWEFIEKSGTVCSEYQAFLTTKHAEREILPACNTGRTYNGTSITRYVQQPSHVQMLHQYTPQSWDYHVQELGIEEMWTPIKQSPSNTHYMALRVMNMGASNAPQDNFIRSIVQITYKVQFREAKASLIKSLDTSVATTGGAGEDPDDT